MTRHPFNPPPVPHSRWRLEFSADNPDALEEYLEQVSVWAGQIIVQHSITESQDDKPELTIVLDVLGADVQSIIELFLREKESWQEIELLTKERDHDNNDNNH